MRIEFEYRQPTGRKGNRRWIFKVADAKTDKPLMTFDCGEVCQFPKALSALKKQMSGAVWQREAYKVEVW